MCVGFVPSFFFIYGLQNMRLIKEFEKITLFPCEIITTVTIYNIIKLNLLLEARIKSNLIPEQILLRYYYEESWGRRINILFK